MIRLAAGVSRSTIELGTGLNFVSAARSTALLLVNCCKKPSRAATGKDSDLVARHHIVIDEVLYRRAGPRQAVEIEMKIIEIKNSVSFAE